MAHFVQLGVSFPMGNFETLAAAIRSGRAGGGGAIAATQVAFPPVRKYGAPYIFPSMGGEVAWFRVGMLQGGKRLSSPVTFPFRYRERKM